MKTYVFLSFLFLYIDTILKCNKGDLFYSSWLLPYVIFFNVETKVSHLSTLKVVLIKKVPN